MIGFDFDKSESSYLCSDLKAGQLPEFIEKAIAVASQPHLQDMLLLSTLTACGYAMPHVKMLHGNPQHTYYPNIMMLIVAGPASGKNVMSCAERLLTPIEKRLEMVNRVVFIPANSSSAAFHELFHANGGQGFIFATEIDEMSKMWKKDYCDYSEFLRLAAEHETPRRARVKPGVGVVAMKSSKPRLSILMSGTPGQLKPLLGSRENGLASRFQPYIVTDMTDFDESVMKNCDRYVTGGMQEVYAELSEELLARWEWLSAQDHDCIWSLTKEQEDILAATAADCHHLLFREENYTEAGARIGMPLSFEANYRRTLVTIKRIGMILSAMRLPVGESLPEVLYCGAEDFQTMVLLFEKLLMHSAKMALLLPEEEEALQVENAGGRPKRDYSFVETLPRKFSTKEAVEAGAKHNLSERSVMRWISDAVKNKVITKTAMGHYRFL